MACPRCGSTAPALQGRCVSCGASLGADDATVLSAVLTPPPPNAPSDGETVVAPPVGQSSSDAHTVLASALTPQPENTATPRPASGSSTPRPASGSHGPLQAGQDFGARYHLIKLLGIGGMGAVYQAWDKALEVAVAIKVIRPPETMDAHEAQAAERRFKRELLLARQVTHRNVVRIHDLGEIDGITYITMPYVQGSDLATIMKREGRMPADRVIGIARQVAAGLSAAHEAGVVHRDLKPANIMVTADGEALIMDFGIARATTGSHAAAMTAGGAVVGTIEFMAPEQARGGTIDQRADIYAFGLILNDLLLGKRQNSGMTSVGELMERMQQPPASVRSIDPTIPAALDALITRCVQPDPLARYQRMADVLTDLGGEGRTASATLPLTQPLTQPYTTPTTATGAVVVPPRRLGPWLIAGAVVVILGVGVYAFRDRIFTATPATTATAPAGPTISLAIVPFRNTSGDATLDSLGVSLSEILRTELGESSALRTVPSNRMHQVLQDLKISAAASLAPGDLNRIADYTNARRVLWGTYERFGTDAIRINAILQDLDQNKSETLSSLAQNGTSASLLAAVADLAEKVRANLAKGAPSILSELTKTSWKPSTTSMEAMQLYSEGVLLTQEGAHQEARKRFEAATQKDPNFALAFSALARASAAAGFDDDAVRFSRQAMSLSDGLPAQEKYLIQANNFWITNDSEKAIEAYENLAKASPNSAAVLFDLGDLYEQTGELEKAQQKYETVVKLDPKFVEGLLALGRVEIKRRNLQASLEHLNTAKTLAIELNRDEARGNILQAIGIAYKLLNKPDEALKNYRDSLEIKTKLGNQKGMAGSLGEIAQIQERMGKVADAEQSYRAALKLQRQIGDKAGTSVTLINLAGLLNEALGKPNDALPLLQESLQIRRDAGNQPGEALVLNNIGNVYLAKGDFAEATTYFERALEIHEKTKNSGDLADTLHNLGETLSKRGKYDDALKRYLRALDLRRTGGDARGAAIESYSIGTILDYQGSFGRALKSKQDALKTFDDLKVRDFWHGEILSGYGNSLTLAGRLDEAKKALDDATTMAVELKNPSLIAQTARFQADRLYYSGDLKNAGAEADKATQAAATASDRSLTLLAQATVARTAAAASPTAALAAKLGTLSEQADALGLKSLAVECALLRAGTLLKIGQLPAARTEIDRTLTKAETLGFRLLAIKAHYLLAEVLRANKNAGATPEYALALRLLNQIVAEEGNDQTVKRTDLAALKTDCERYSKG